MTDPQHTDGEHPAPGWLRWASRGALAIGVVALVVTVYVVGPGSIVRHLRAIGGWFALTLGLDLLASGFDAGVVYAFVRDDRGPSYGRVLVAQLAGRAIDSVTPGGAVGEAVKANLVAEVTSVSRAIAAVVYGALISVMVSLALVAIGAPLTGAFLADLPTAMRWSLVASGALAVVAVVGLATLVHRGLLASVANAGVRVHLLSPQRRKRWRRRLDRIDERLHGTRGSAARQVAVACGVASKAIGWCGVWVTLRATGYDVSFAMLAALLSAGVLLSWISGLVPMGIGVSESGSYAMFAALGAPTTVGVTLAFARRVNQVVFAVVGFAVLAAWRLATRRALLAAPARRPVAEVPA